MFKITFELRNHIKIKIYFIMKNMKYLVFSDIHGDEDAFLKLLKIAKKKNCDTVLSAGDFTPTLNMEAEASLIDFRTVMGNMDYYHNYGLLKRPRDFLEIHDNERDIVITHGDRYSSSSFQLSSGDVFISGHTHVAMLENINGIIHLNPGSPSRPRDKRKSYAMLSEKKIELLTFPHSFLIKELIF